MLPIRTAGRPGPAARALLMIAALLAAAAPAAGQTFSNTAPLLVPDGQSNPYPSTITVAGVASVRKLTVTLTDVQHSRFSDMRVLLVGPGNQAVQLMSKCGPTSGVGPVTLVFDDAGASAPAIGTAITSGTFRPSDCYLGFITYPAPAPAGPYGTALSVYAGTNPNGQWRLFVLDDASGATGMVSGGWSITITPDSASSSVPVNMFAAGPATPYPSTAQVSGMTGVISKVRIRVRGFTHERPQDVDMLLVGPNNQACWLMSDVGGTTPVSGLDLFFDDDAATPLPPNTTFAAGPYRPSNPDNSEILPPPAPQTMSMATLSVFNGRDPNGAWSLYLVDDLAGALGGITGWDLFIDTRVPCVADVNRNNQADLIDIFLFLEAWFAGCP